MIRTSGWLAMSCGAVLCAVDGTARGQSNCDGNNDCPKGEFCLFEPGACGSADGVCTPTPDACFDIYDPVCGCDGVTYSNGCYAQLAGVSVAFEGECPPQACTNESDTCDADEYCFFPRGTCGSVPGTCTEIPPPICPAVFDPHCGCDGVTYSNSCFAAAAGVSINHPGPCDGGGQCGGLIGIPCEAGEFCLTPDGACCCDISGMCTPIPDACDLVFDPVCGCDGITYSNRCFAHANGVSVDHQGPCGEPCSSDADCGDTAFCQFATGTCGTEQGTCVEFPLVCPDHIDPVCSCNLGTYNNACEAAMAGQSILHSGPCGQMCGGFIGLQCENPDDFCNTPPGQCCCDFFGECTPVPQICPLIFDPVCGCDGMTYSNACFAAAAAVPIDHFGACEVVIVSANPPIDNPYIAGVQPFVDVLDTGESNGLTAGIGAAGTNPQNTIEYAPIRVTFSGDAGGILPADITVNCTGGDCPSVTAVESVGINEYAISLDHAIPPGECTTLLFTSSSIAGQRLDYRSLPGDVTHNGITNTQDLLGLVQALNNATANLPFNWARYNVNRSLPMFTPGGPIPPVNTQDLLRLVQLLNGTNTTQPFNGATAAGCP